MPPGNGITKKLVRGEHLLQKGEDDEAIQYFDKVLPRLKSSEGPTGSNRLPVIIEGVQYPGETIFVPGNWWHGVQNLDLTIAITQNFCNEGNFDKVWLRTRKGRKRLSVRFLAKLKIHKPELYRRAVQMNQRDNFIMWDKRDKYKARFAKKPKKVSVDPETGAQQEDAKEESSDESISSSSSSSSSSSDSSSDAEDNGERQRANSSSSRSNSSGDTDSSDLDS
jgi:histone arginine demethylase JMJD6